MGDNKNLQRVNLLQEGVSCAQAMLHVIESADLFRALPRDAADIDRHGHGSSLIAMLADHLNRIQQQVDALDAPLANTRGEASA